MEENKQVQKTIQERIDEIEKRISNYIFDYFGEVHENVSYKSCCDNGASIATEVLTEHYNKELQAKDEEIERLKGGGWISVKDRLPEDTQRVLFITTLVDIVQLGVFIEKDDVRKLNNIMWSGGGYYTLKSITHWIPLPEPPKE